MIGGPDDPEMCVACFQFVPLGERCPSCGEYVVDLSGAESRDGSIDIAQCAKHGSWTTGTQSCPQCQSEQASPAAIPPWLIQLRGVYGDAFVSWVVGSLRGGEELIEAAPAISENVARVDRADREGTIGVTNQRLVFVSKRRGVLWHNIDLRIVGPIKFSGRRHVFINALVPTEGEVNLMIGKKQAQRVRPALELALQLSKRPGR